MRLYYRLRLCFIHGAEVEDWLRQSAVGDKLCEWHKFSNSRLLARKERSDGIAKNERQHRVCGVSSITSTTHKKDTQQGVLFVVGRGGFEPPKSKTSDLQSDPFGRSGICPYEIDFVVEPVIGLEPTTC